MGDGYFAQACGAGGVVRIGGIKRSYSGAGFFEYFNRRLLERVGGFRGSNQAFCAVHDFLQAGNIAGSFHVGYDSFELPGIRRAQSFQYTFQLFIVQDNIRAAAFQVVGNDAALSFHYAAVRATDEFQKIQAHHLIAHGFPSFLNEGVVKAGYGVLCNVIDELPSIEVNGAIDAVFEKGTAAGAQVAVGVDNKLAIVFINTADADVAVGGDTVAVGVGNVVVAAGGEDFCAGEVEFFNKVFEFVFRRDGAKLHAGYRICFVQFFRKSLSQGFPNSCGHPIKKENGCRGSQQDSDFSHSDSLCVTRKPAHYSKKELFTNHDSLDYSLEVASRMLTKVNLSADKVKNSQGYARLFLLCSQGFAFYERIEQAAARLSGSLPEDHLVWFRSSFIDESLNSRYLRRNLLIIFCVSRSDRNSSANCFFKEAMTQSRTACVCRGISSHLSSNSISNNSLITIGLLGGKLWLSMRRITILLSSCFVIFHLFNVWIEHIKKNQAADYNNSKLLTNTDAGRFQYRNFSRQVHLTTTINRFSHGVRYAYSYLF
ncbi:MAG: hypothetical protein HRU77_04255 [Gammaproteobacteria bacterium]|nr:MAG: hypothetical protein HRU77_04255 [Gammaproteobacteria bacterium]